MVCRSCGTLVPVIELPAQWMQPWQFTCHNCLTGQGTALFSDEPEVRPYDPAEVEIPY